MYVEPFVLFNFGQVGTTLPGTDRGTVLSFHSYALDVAGEESVVANALAAAERDQVPPVATEFGATVDVPTLHRLTGQLDDGLSCNPADRRDCEGHRRARGGRARRRHGARHRSGAHPVPDAESLEGPRGLVAAGAVRPRALPAPRAVAARTSPNLEFAQGTVAGC